MSNFSVNPSVTPSATKTHRNRIVSFIRALFVSAAVIAVICLSVIGGIQFVSTYFEVKEELAACQAENVALKAQLSKSLIPETSWSEFAKNRIVSPVANAAKSAKDAVTGVFTEKKPEPTPAEDVVTILKGWL